MLGKSVVLLFLPAIVGHSVSGFTFFANVKLTSFSAPLLAQCTEEVAAE